MNPTQPITRRDVFALLTYVSLGYSAMTWILVIVDQLVLSRITLFKSPGVFFGNNWPAVVSAFLFSLACLPFVSLIANAAAGKRATHPVTKSDVFSLILPCVGLILFLTSLPQFISTAYNFWQTSSTLSKSIPSNNQYYLRYVASITIRLSVGFCFAFFPAIFESLRLGIRNNENTSF